MTIRRRAAFCCVSTVCLLASSAQAGSGGAPHPFATVELPTAGSYPGGIVAGADGRMWFTETNGNAVGRFRAGEAIQEFPIPGTFSSAGTMTLGPGGNIWFTEYEASAIGRITPAGVISRFPLPNASASPLDITLGADGNVWFTALLFSRGLSSSLIGRVTPAGTISEFIIEGR